MRPDWLLRCNVAAATFRLEGTDVGEEPPTASWRPGERRLTLTRDPTGLRPLFYAWAEGGDLVASISLAALLAEPGVTRKPSRDAVAAWLTDAPSRPEETLLEGVKRVPAGHVLELTPGGETHRRWWSPPACGSIAAGEAATFGRALERAVERAAAWRRSCIFLSGGIDSGTVAVAAGQVARGTGTHTPLGLCVVFPGASEEFVQRRVSWAAGLDLLFAPVEMAGLAERALERAAGSLWPTSAPWAPTFDDLAAMALDKGAEVLFDGQGGDELLDAGYEAGRVLVRNPVALYDWLRAERAYTGRVRRSLKILALDLAGRLDQSPPAAPAWLADDLHSAMKERFADRPHGYAAVRSADLLDGVLAAQREETYTRGQATGLDQRHPFWDPEVVSLLDGLAPAALVAGGDPKAPGRAYLRKMVPAVVGRWPRPAVADAVSARVGLQLEAILEASAGLPALEELGILRPGYLQAGLARNELWRMMSLDGWLQRTFGGRRDT